MSEEISPTKGAGLMRGLSYGARVSAGGIGTEASAGGIGTEASAGGIGTEASAGGIGTEASAGGAAVGSVAGGAVSTGGMTTAGRTTAPVAGSIAQIVPFGASTPTLTIALIELYVLLKTISRLTSTPSL